jgi:hypothetical protein
VLVLATCPRNCFGSVLNGFLSHRR